jgi:mono/diheme cytochrome c family protein
MKAIKILGIILLLIFLGVLAAGTYVKVALPKAEAAPELTIEPTQERLERGEYLANHVAVCMDCHSKRDWSLFSGPMDTEEMGAGGEIFNQEMGFPGTFYAKNITPYALASWTDGEIFRAITTGVNKDGNALFSLMAYHRFGKMDKEDIYSIIAYIRTLDPVKKDIPEPEIDFPVNILINTMPQPANFEQIPDKKDELNYGRYLINVAGCVDCHSKLDKGTIIEGTEFGGGMEFKQPAGTVRSPNITFHSKNGIGGWSKESFVQRFKMYTDSNYISPSLTPEDLNTPMPWIMYAGMTNEDLGAIYTYLKSINPLDNNVVKFEKK